MIRIDLPFDEQKARSLKVGDEVEIYGTIVTARDAAHKLMIEKEPKELDEILSGSIIYHCGPVMKKIRKGYEVVAAGPTTSIREEPYQGTVMERYNVRGVLGKGGMGPKTLATCKRFGAVYLHAVGGAAVSLAESITEVTDVRMLDLLGPPEAFWVLRVDGFPAVVTMDSRGRSLHTKVSRASAKMVKELL